MVIITLTHVTLKPKVDMEIAVGNADGILAVPVIVNRRKLKGAFDQIV